MRNFINTKAPSLVLLCVTVALVLLATTKVISGGLCCADDAFYADIAKNLAYGVGYGPATEGEGFQIFAPDIGTGPAMIVPLALMIWLFGNQYWLPGIVAICYWFVGFLFAFYLLHTYRQIKHLKYASIFFVLAVFLIFPLHFEQWYTFLGEVHAAMFILSSFIIMSIYPLSWRAVAYSSTLLSFAFLSKNISAIYYVAYLMVFFVKIVYFDKRPFRVACGYGLLSLSFFSFSLICFETYKLYVLGSDGYLDNLQKTWTITRAQAAPPVSSSIERLIRATQYDKTFSQRFGFSVFQLSLMSLLSLIVIGYQNDSAIRWMACFLTVGILMSSFWLLFYSIGWPRYLVTTVVLFIVLISLVIYVLEYKQSLIYGVSILLFLLSFNYQKIPYMFSGFDNGIFTQARRLSNALSLTKFIDSQIGTIPFATQTWVMTADIEYYSSHVGVFRKYSLFSKENDVLLVYNQKFQRTVDKDIFNSLLSHCKTLNTNYEPYVILSCNPIE